MPRSKPTLDWLRQRAEAMRLDASDRNKAFEYYDKAENQEWDLPEDLKATPWVMKATEPQYAQALAAGTNIISGKRPTINIIPDDIDKRELADQWEQALDIILKDIDRNRETDLIEEMGHAILKYGMSPVLVRYLPKEKGDDRGQFTVDVYSSSTVYPRFTTRGLQEVLLIEENVDIEDLRDVYGDDKIAKLEQAISAVNVEIAGRNRNAKEKSPLVHTVRKYEHCSKDWYSCWAELVGAPGSGEAYEIKIEKWPHRFLPWSVRARGYQSESRQDAQARGLLYNAYAGDEVDLANRVRSLRFSDSIRYAGAPRRTFQSDSRETPDIDASGGEVTAHIKSDEALTQMDPWLPDPNMASLYSEIRMDHERNTLSSVLLGGEIPSQAAFSSINLVTHSAMGALRPFINALQRQLNDVLYIIMCYLYETKEPYVARTRGPNDEVVEFYIQPKEIDPKNLRIETSIDASLPTDNQARAATAGMLIDRNVISRREARTELGYRNDTDIQRQIIREMFVDAFLTTGIENIRTTESMTAMQEIRAQLMQELQQQAMMQQGEQMAMEQSAPEEPQGMPLPEEPMPPTGIPAEANPAEGGPVPAQFNPGATREGQTGETVSGETIV